MGDFVGERVQPVAAGCLGDGAAFKGCEVAVAGLFAASQLSFDRGEFRLSGWSLMVGELGGECDGILDVAGVAEG